MIYWVTQSYGTSARYYYEAAHDPSRPVHDRMPAVEAPVSVSVLPKKIVIAPRRWAQRYYNLKQMRHHASGGHFAAMKMPEPMTPPTVKKTRSLNPSRRGSVACSDMQRIVSAPARAVQRPVASSSLAELQTDVHADLVIDLLETALLRRRSIVPSRCV
jgi:hypothetical protein